MAELLLEQRQDDETKVAVVEKATETAPAPFAAVPMPFSVTAYPAAPAMAAMKVAILIVTAKEVSVHAF